MKRGLAQSLRLFPLRLCSPSCDLGRKSSKLSTGESMLQKEDAKKCRECGGKLKSIAPFRFFSDPVVHVALPTRFFKMCRNGHTAEVKGT
jgi:hypothetical protein